MRVRQQDTVPTKKFLAASVSAVVLFTAAMGVGSLCSAQTTRQYVYDDAGELYRALDSTGTLIEYDYDLSGNITKVNRSTVPPSQLFVLNVTPSNIIAGSTITIVGQNFSATAAGDTVMIGGVKAMVISATATQLVVLAPTGTLGGAVSVTVGGVTATWSNMITVLQPPLISSISPPSAPMGTTVSVTVAGQFLAGATFVLKSLDPVDTSPSATVTVLSNSGTLATFTLVLGATEGEFALVGTNDVGASNITPASLFLIGPPAGQNSASFYASVLNTSATLPPGQNSASYYISVCNTSSGCTAMPPALVSVNGSPASTRPRSATPSQGSPLRGSLPVLEPLEAIRSVTLGQTIRLGARNVDPRSIIEFDVNQVAIATVTEAPYETLFTIPDGPAELVFQVIVRAPSQPERLSQITRLTVVPDSGTNIQGNVAEGTRGVELSLAAGGLKAEFFHLTQPVTVLPSLDGVHPVRSGYVTAINEPNPDAVFGDDPLGAHLGFDYAVRFSGEVRADQPGQYRFWLTARNGAAMWIDGKPLADSGFVSGEPAETSVSLALDRGWHSIEVIYYLAVGDSSVGLDWQQPGSGRREVLGPEYLRTVLSGMTIVSTADGTFTFPQVPQKFDAVWVRAKQGDGFIEFPAVKPGAGPVSILIPK